ncbi:thiol reductant ABC exporter subunit CydD [Vandammella animalimorsus]|uniref:Thiol reductant ABC exporter subunit CydD n=1 Tax=Vandammella animalimorsus TaxID=2029117 RepID=A0A2A2AQL7_9BURK|nr:thiol reductant ABC exporter subunit CydD [Vandammella animalimorsus]PAT40885.1 thiol reductant ABC exporter subunit CydD [Vandammella animalimorsus]
MAPGPSPLPAQARGWWHALPALASLLWVGQAWQIATAIAALLAWQDGGGSAAGLPPPTASLVQAAAITVALGLLRAALEYAGTRLAWRHARCSLTALRLQLGQRLRHSSPLDARRPPSGQITSAWMEQADAVLPWLARYQLAQWRVLLAPPALALCVGWHSWLAALLLLLAAPLIPLFMAIIGWRAQAISEAQLQALGHLHGDLLQRLRALPSLRALHAVQATAQRMSALGRDLAQRTMRVLRVAMLSSAVLELFSALGVALVAVYVGFHLLGQLPFGAWGARLTLHEGLFVLMLAPAFFEPLRELSAVWHDRANGRAALQRLHTLLDELAPLVPNALTEGEGEGQSEGQPPAANTAANTAEPAAPAVPAGAPAITLQAVQPALPLAEGQAARPALDLHIPAGAHVAITGPSGSGKSLLLALVAGLVQPASGQVRIGGLPMDAVHAAALRRRMGWMGAQPYVFAGSLQRNLRLGRAAPATPEDEARALQQVGLGAFVQQRSQALLGEGGSGLSGGEALRLALARLVAAPGATLLLLDEPTAHLDSATSAQVLAQILTLAQGRTLLLATHEPQAIAALPWVLQLDAQGQARWRRRPDAPTQEMRAAAPAAATASTTEEALP